MNKEYIGDSAKQDVESDYINRRDTAGYTVFHNAAQSGDIDSIKSLLANGAPLL